MVAPVVFPVASALGVEPSRLGSVMVVNMEIGMTTPPVGLNLFVTAGITGMSVMQVVRAALPWLGILYLLLLLITYLRAISTLLPNTLMRPQRVNACSCRIARVSIWAGIHCRVREEQRVEKKH